MTSRFVPRSVLVALASSMLACGSSGQAAPDGVFFPTVPIADAYPAGDIEGELELRSGCLFVTRPEDRWLILWPEGYSAREAEGVIEVLDEEDHLVASEGERIRLGGGETNPLEVGGTAQAEQHATELTDQDIPKRCGDLYWLVSPPGF